MPQAEQEYFGARLDDLQDIHVVILSMLFRPPSQDEQQPRELIESAHQDLVRMGMAVEGPVGHLTMPTDYCYLHNRLTKAGRRLGPDSPDCHGDGQATEDDVRYSGFRRIRVRSTMRATAGFSDPYHCLAGSLHCFFATRSRGSQAAVSTSPDARLRFRRIKRPSGENSHLW
jgi:hypothetical protein